MNIKSIITGLFLFIGLTGAQAEDIQLQDNGLTLNAVLEKASENWPEGPVVLMTHGTLAHGKMEIMAGLQSMLKERGISSLSITLSLGLDNRKGMYDCTTPHTHSHTDAVVEIGLWHNWLKSEGVKKVALLGHSRGGNQTARYAALTKDDSIVYVFLVAPQVLTADYNAIDYKNRYKQELLPLLNKAQALTAEGKGNHMMEDIDFIYCEKAKASAEAFVSYYQEDDQMDTTNLISDIDYPVTVFAGSEDNTVKNLIQKAQEKVDGEKSQLVVIDGADHFFRDLYSEEIADMISEAIGE